MSSPKSTVRYPRKVIPGPRFTKQPSFAIRDYLDERLDAQTAIKACHRHGALGHLFAGDIGFQQAIREPHRAERWANLAVTEYAKAARYMSDTPDADSAHATHATVKLAQMSVMTSLLFDKKMPSEQTVNQAYEHTVLAGHELGSTMVITNGNQVRKHHHETIGYLSELGILAMGQRYALRQKITDCWLPVEATPDQNHTTVTNSLDLRNSWDVSIVCQSGSEQPKIDYKLQVKTRRGSASRDAHTTKYADDIIMVNLHPDLEQPSSRMYQREAFFGAKIISQCAEEIVGINDDGYNSCPTRQLDIRTSLLLGIIES